MKLVKILLFGLLFFCGNYVFSQEIAPEKRFEFTIGINKLKTQQGIELSSGSFKTFT